MEFEDEHDEEQEEEEEEDEGEEITIPPPPPPSQAPPSYDLAGPVGSSGTARPRGRRSGGIRYRECLKNHAVNIGGHALDGCGEFMPAGEEGTLDALKCAACNCHRNFHRREITDAAAAAEPPPSSSGAYYPQVSPYYRMTTPAGYFHAHQQRPLAALPSISGGTHSGEIDDSGGGSGGVMKKRFRTKFTQEQKDKMLAFAEKVGWRVQKHDEAAVDEFCAEAQIKRQVLKVWMHNNKSTLGKK